MKKNRQEKLLELITEYEIETQDDLIARLRESGYNVTQATVSRDIRELQIVKMATGHGTYRYAIPKPTEPAKAVSFSTALIDSITGSKSAGNIVVLKTYPGLASAVAGGIDRMNIDWILGCVAGDDTIFIVTEDAESAKTLSTQVHDLLRGL